MLALNIAACAGECVPDVLSQDVPQVSQSSVESALNTCWSLSSQATEAFKGLLPSGDNVVKQLYFTAVVESGGGKHTKQLGGGPARSLFQIEPFTAKDVYFRYLESRDSLKETLLKFSALKDTDVSKEKIGSLLESNPKFAAGIARLVYAMQKSSIPNSDLWEDYANYWKKFYQKGGSKGLSAKEALFNFNQLTK